ncbi:MAG: oxidoreductase domain protein [Bryobacterales bacterium]|nr:oxidoreductase domain protein [Bryobacterales bacterium]
MSNTTRRFFLGAATAAAASRVWGANDKINIGIVGLGGRGNNHLDTYPKIAGARVAALCDVNQAALETGNAKLVKATGEKAKEFGDMRALFADPGVEAVSIVTPNHWHALASIWAMKAGKDVYCEKPAAYNLHEGERFVQVARETKKIVQIGSQHRSTPFKMKGIEAIQQGAIGKVYLAKGLCFKRRISIGHKEDSPTPPGVNWDMFLGPAPRRPFNELRFKYNWHWFWDTGNGDIGNQGVHEMGIARWGLGDPAWPLSGVSTGGKYYVQDDQETPNTQMASFDYGGRELIFEVRGGLTGGEGAQVRGKGVAAPTTAPVIPMTGDLFYGSEGWASMSDQGCQIYKGEGSELVNEFRPTPGENTTQLHMENFLAALRVRDTKVLHDGIENAVFSAGLCHIANISYRTGHKLTLDNGPKFKNDVDANKLVSRPAYSKGFEV